jgi:hypothetical protein
MSRYTEQITLAVTPEMKAAILAEAETQDRSISWILRDAWNRYHTPPPEVQGTAPTPDNCDRCDGEFWPEPGQRVCAACAAPGPVVVWPSHK